jgi:hypothetical protein
LERLTAGDREPARERLIPRMNAKYLDAMRRPAQFPPTVEEPGLRRPGRHLTEASLECDALRF